MDQLIVLTDLKSCVILLEIHFLYNWLKNTEFSRGKIWSRAFWDRLSYFVTRFSVNKLWTKKWWPQKLNPLEFLNIPKIWIFQIFGKSHRVYLDQHGASRSLGLHQDTLFNRTVPRHSAISGLGPKYSRNFRLHFGSVYISESNGWLQYNLLWTFSISQPAGNQVASSWLKVNWLLKWLELMLLRNIQVSVASDSKTLAP